MTNDYVVFQVFCRTPRIIFSNGVRLTGLPFLSSSFLSFLKIGTMFARFELASGTSLDSQGDSKIFERSCNGISQHFVNPINALNHIGIHLDQQISHNFRVSWGMIICVVRVLQLRALVCHCVEDRGREGINPSALSLYVR